MENELAIIISLILSVTSITMFAACLCCRKKVQNNELLGLEGMVKIKNPDENLLNGNHTISIGNSDIKISTNDITDSKRSLNVPHRSLPDIPISVPNQLDTNSDLYATVGDKVGDKPQGQSPSPGVKKKISVSQHSSISQADDCSSPYARVRSPSHAYDKVRPAEHPYAQVKSVGDNGNRASTSNATATTNNLNAENNNQNENDSLSRRSSHESLLDSIDGRQHQVIPAASAIAGRVSASQELPYMTPPIVQPQQQYFSGDSQDSSKGYTSISVREPLANIIAQTKKQNAQIRRREISDSHYATVSDDSDEMYAAIEDPNNPVELYTSGSETYAQIQPQEPMVVSVEINSVPAHPNNVASQAKLPHTSNQSHALIPTTATTPRNSMNEANLDMVKAAAHSRQASSSSCTSSVANLGSPKPEKRQANSPLPPTPKGNKSTHHYQSNSSLANPLSLQSGRSSVASVIEVSQSGQRQVSRENLASSTDGRNHLRPLHGNDDEPRKNRLSKDLEGMYAKVMKKNKLSSAPSENTSPVPFRKVLNDQQQRQSVFLSDPDIAHEINLPESLSKSIHTSPGKSSIKSTHLNDDNDYETIDKRRTRSSNANYESKNDPGYETIPADLPGGANQLNANRNTSHAPTPPAMFLQKLSSKTSFASNYGGESSEPGYESLPDQSSNDPGYETVEQTHTKDSSKKNGSDYDPNYETLRPTMKSDSIDHYAQVLNKSKLDDSNDGYSSIKPVKNTILSSEEDEQLGYCTISEDRVSTAAKNHDYASIGIRDTTKDENFYSSITNDMEPELTRLSSTASTPSPIIVSPNMDVSITSTIADTKTLTSPSSDGDSSSNTPINYNSIRSTDRSQLTVSVSNYESLTGSESDSNYESVRYLNAKDRENPYEQLYNESDIKYDTLKRDNTCGNVSELYATPSKNADFSKNSSLSSSSASGARSSSSLNNNSDSAG